MKILIIITPGVLQRFNGRLVCNFWKFIDLNSLTEEEKYSIEQYIENVESGIFVQDEDYNINIVEEQEYKLNINDNEE